jgi:hypothetical protein
MQDLCFFIPSVSTKMKQTVLASAHLNLPSGFMLWLLRLPAAA